MKENKKRKLGGLVGRKGNLGRGHSLDKSLEFGMWWDCRGPKTGVGELERWQGLGLKKRNIHKGHSGEI